jgi:hypothetical protein
MEECKMFDQVLTQASTQWMNRPADERFTSLYDMRDMMQREKMESRQSVVSSRSLEADRADDDAIHGLKVYTDQGVAYPTHYAFGQLATRAGAPAGYLRKLPAPIAALNLNYGLRHLRDIEDIGLLQTVSESGDVTLKAATGPNYGRIWNSDIVGRLTHEFGDGVTGDWRVPGEFGRPVTVTKDNTTLYASDRDMFVFLADEKNLIEVPNGRDGQPELLSRGFFVWNSEVGDRTFGMSTFLFRYVCCNRMVWGARDTQTVKIRHSKSAPDRFVEELAPALADYSASSQFNILDSVAKAKEARIETDVAEWLGKQGFNKDFTAKAMDLHEVEEHKPVESLWDAAQAVTAAARDIPNQNERVKIEEAAGKIMDMAA